MSTRLILFVALWLTAGTPLALAADAPRSPTPAFTYAPLRTVTLTKGLEHPWGLAFLPDRRMLVTERPGRLRIVSYEGQLSAPLRGVPKVFAAGQGGLLDVAISPGFQRDGLIYFSYAEPGEEGAGTAVARGRLSEVGLDNVEVIWRQQPKLRGSNHWGSRLVFAHDGTLFITTGDRQSHRERVQELSTTIGKVVRINPDGTIPSDNPFRNRVGAKAEIWSYGHRNVQGAALQPRTGTLFTVEHGARGGDELNAPQAGRNYGWPVITYGVEYSGLRIGEGTAKPGMEQPLYYWDPVIAPSGATFYNGEAFPAWRGSLLVGSLTPGGLVRLELDGERVRLEQRYLGDIGRVRSVVQGPDGFIYLLIDAADGQIVRLEPRR